MARRTTTLAAVALGSAATIGPGLAAAGVTLYDKGDQSVEVGGRIQAQYRRNEPDQGGSMDDFFLRRLRVYIEGTVTEDIYGKWQVDFGKNGSDPAVKDAYIKYSGIPIGHVVVGNHYAPFSREALTSSKRQQTVERQFAGDHNFGVPDRQMGISYAASSDTLIGQIGVYQAGIDPSLSKVDFASRVNSDAEYFGNMVAGRVDFNPLGNFKLAQGAFGSDLKIGVGLNAYDWRNDDDTEFAGPDGVADQYDNIVGYGIDGALRAGYLSIDAAAQGYKAERDADSASAGSATGLVNAEGDADFATYLIKGGYMVVPSKLELISAYSVLDADAYTNPDQRISVGGNYFFNEHKSKIQLTYEFGQDVGGVAGADDDTLYLQFQQVL